MRRVTCELLQTDGGQAKEIWDERCPFGELAMSNEEREEVKRVWSQMPGNTCFVDALFWIICGEDQLVPILVGTAVFLYGGEIIEQTPVYWGETADSIAVRSRAERSITMLGMPATDPVTGCNMRLMKMKEARVAFYPRGN